MPFKQITNSQELLQLLNVLYKNNGYYVNVLAQDQLTKIKPKYKTIIIVNFERKNEYGIGHWVVVICKNNKECFYFDPFGQAPPESILKFMRKFKQKKLVYELKYNKRIIQKFKDEYCGWATLKFVDLYLKSDAVKAIKQMNSKNIISYGEQLYNTYL
jgi:hypothetical protein